MDNIVANTVRVEKHPNHIKILQVTSIWMHGSGRETHIRSSGCARPEVPPPRQRWVEVSLYDTRARGGDFQSLPTDTTPAAAQGRPAVGQEMLSTTGLKQG